MHKYVAAIDQGTSSTRCILFNESGEIKASAQKEHAQIYPQPGWVEHNPFEIWKCTQDVIQEAVAAADAIPASIAAVGITNQRETSVLWDKTTGKPYTNAIVWQDTRTKTICDGLASEGGIDRFRPQSGLPLATYFSGPKIKWILENHPEARAAAAQGKALFGTMDTWMIWWLTGGPDGGVHVTDVTNASRTMLMDLGTLDWNRDILDILCIPPQVLPRIVSSSDPNPWGFTHRAGPFQGNIPICGDLGDQQAALVGQVCFLPGEGKNTYGTGCFLLINTGHEAVHSNNGLLTTLAYRLGENPAVYALEGSVAITGALVQWLRDNLGMIGKAAEVETLARSVPDNGGVYFVPAFSGLFAPYWRSDARGIIAGLTRFSNKGHLARASLEATAFQVYEVVEAMQQDWGVDLNRLKVDGGMVSNDLLMQFQADLLGVPVIRSKIAETTALGAAYAAGLAVGFWSSQEELQANWRANRTWVPAMSVSERQRLVHEWKKAVDRTLNWVD